MSKTSSANHAAAKHMSPTRTKATWKPGISDDSLPFFRCPTCGSIMCGIDGAQGVQLSGLERRPDATLPYASNTFAPTCCGQAMEPLAAASPEAADRLGLTYDVVGGFDMNALRVSWKHALSAPRWVALKTFTGMQLKYVLPGKRPPLVFALGDEDAYAYCDEDPCLACTFHCKRGFELYAYLEGEGVVSAIIHQEALTA